MKSAERIPKGYVNGIRAIYGDENAEGRIRNARIFVDHGSLVRDQDPEDALLQVVMFCMDSIREVNHVKYHDYAQKAFVLVDVNNPNNRKTMLDPRNNCTKNPAQLCTFMDAAWATGPDPLMMDNGFEIMTCGPTSATLKGFLQGIMRERKFLSGQQMDIVASNSIENKQVSFAQEGKFEKLQEFNEKYGRFLPTTDLFDVDKRFQDLRQSKTLGDMLKRI
jgi:hypothetical protein